MPDHPSSPDVVVIGGGPAGAVASSVLAEAGHRVVVYERERFPRYHVGESLLSATLPLLDAIGATPAIERHGFVPKTGGTFVWGRQAEPWTFWFREDPGGRPHAYQVVRSEFDTLLLENARAHGVAVHEEHAVTSVAGGDGEPLCLRVRARGGVERAVTPRFVVDASGQAAVVGRARNLRRFDDFFRNLAVFGYFRDAVPLTGDIAGQVYSVAFADGWFWYIPLHDGTTSVGAVVDARRWRETAEHAVAPTFRELIARCPPIAERLTRASLVSPVRAVRDYSYTSSRFAAPGYLLAGDAACFVDPIFSTGIHLACLAGFLGAHALDACLRGTVSDAVALARYDSVYRTVVDRFLRFLYFFYDHHVDPESEFWRARRLLAHRPSDPSAREDFLRLVSGDRDLPVTAELVDREHARWAQAIRLGRTAVVPGLDVLRVRTTTALMAERMALAS